MYSIGVYVCSVYMLYNVSHVDSICCYLDDVLIHVWQMYMCLRLTCVSCTLHDVFMSVKYFSSDVLNTVWRSL